MTAARVHDAMEVCRNADRAKNLGHHFDAEDLRMGRIDRPGTDYCSECEGAFDDPRHGVASKCPRKTRHVCQFA